MRPAHSIAQVGGFVVLKTDHGRHTARQWARATAGQIMSIEDNVTPERRVFLERIQTSLVEAIEPFFRAAIEGRGWAATEALSESVKTAEGSPWAANFAHPEIRAAILHALTVNLNTAAIQPKE